MKQKEREIEELYNLVNLRDLLASSITKFSQTGDCAEAINILDKHIHEKMKALIGIEET